ncbi:hypothetical protein [Streptomyces cavernicola]|uniref:Uncharacterized protein n=1 Tax=Streptomyces cavernicola TaxID=3043613 RepID=A0ABT6S940_9ACTN|nr:hypothetical protein [Streptomyces sp. B-S-A6]MDI3404614.1 hypothetical protein [Streptomyces sp. B-S-A6]
MSSARHLHAIDQLRARTLRGGHSHLTELRRTDFDETDPGEYEERREQYEAELAALQAPLGEKWAAYGPFGLQGVLLRGGEGEEIPEPWCGLSWAASSVELWHTGDRWLALAVTDRERPRLLRLLAVSTDVDPP